MPVRMPPAMTTTRLHETNFNGRCLLSTVGDLKDTPTPGPLSTAGDIYSFRMPEIRPRDAAQTRADILAAARRRFAAGGVQRTTLRALASAGGGGAGAGLP